MVYNALKCNELGVVDSFWHIVCGFACREACASLEHSTINNKSKFIMKIIRSTPLTLGALGTDEWFNRALAGFDVLSRFVPAPTPVEWLGRSHLPADLFEDDHNYHVRVEIPGAKKDEVGVRVEEGQLHVSYQRAGEENRAAISLTRSFRLPGPVSVDGISARLENGILQVTLPRHEESKPRVIAVN